jgi:signal transduction histidine kinase
VDGRRRIAYWGLWTLVGAYLTTMDVFFAPWPVALVSNLARAWTWGGLAMLSLALVRRFPLGRRVGWRPWALHAAAGAAFTLLDLAVGSLVTRALFPRPTLLTRFSWSYFFAYFHYTQLTYWGVLGVFTALETYRKFRAREFQAAQLEAELAHAQVQALKMQLQPHFLFNALNGVSSLIHTDPPGANRMVLRLGDLLRKTLELEGRQEIPLAEELGFLRAYLAIEETRFRDRLAVEWDVPEALGPLMVPAFLLQPLVENSLRHGLAPRAEGGRLKVRARTQGNALCLEVEDDGVGFDPASRREGIGTSNVRARLERLHGALQRFELESSPGTGTTARILLPLKESLEVGA